MKTSPFKITIFIINILILMFAILLCCHFNVFEFISETDFGQVLYTTFNNGYIISILSSIIAVIILYVIQIIHCKRKIKKDIRCNEIMEDIQTAIEWADELFQLPINTNKGRFNYIDFYKANKSSFETTNKMFLYHNNNILIESVQSVFFININFKLLNIVNNIKNRKPNIESKYKAFKEALEAKNISEKLIDAEIEDYLTDLKFYAQYWKALLDYLKFDNYEQKKYNEIFNSKYDIHEVLKLPTKQQNKILKSVTKLVKKKIRKEKFKNFFKK